MILSIIPAKGHSQRIPGKNLRELGGKPLLVWTLEAAISSSEVGRVIVSTDSEDVVAIARRYDVETTMRRPSEATFECVDVARDHDAEIIVMLLPTSPFRSGSHIDDAIALHRYSRGANIVSGVMRHVFHDGKPGVRKTLVPNGAIWIAERRRLLEDGYFAPDVVFPMNPEEGLDVDYPHEWAAAEWIVRNSLERARRPGVLPPQ